MVLQFLQLNIFKKIEFNWFFPIFFSLEKSTVIEIDENEKDSENPLMLRLKNNVGIGSISCLSEEMLKSQDDDFTSISQRSSRLTLTNNSQTNSFMKVKKDFNDRKSKLMKSDQKPMMFMHDC